jgi:triphosphoribosyl-dephospho-CoA synthase
MLRSAIAVGPELGRAGQRGVGDTVLAAVEASRHVAPSNTNLGIALLLAPLAKAALDGGSLRERLGTTLGALDVADARAAYAAIRVAGAGGLRERVEHDVRSEPSIGLREAMASAAERDSIASEYVTGYALTFDTGLPALAAALDDALAVRDAIVELHLRLLAQVPDSLISRKRGSDAAQRVSADARAVLVAGGVRTPAGRRALLAFDASLREPGNALNPGTTADLVTSTLFVALIERML